MESFHKTHETGTFKLNPLNGFKRIFSKDSLFELVKSILKIVIIIYIAYTSIKDNANDLFALYDLGLNQAVALVGTLIINTGIKISIVYLVIGLADFIYQKHKFNEDMKMTKQEVKDEYKNTEGDPQIKGRQRRKMQEVSQKRMMQDVPKADVVITNPTHFAVALKYEAKSQFCPGCPCKRRRLPCAKRLRKWRGRIKLKLLKISLWHVCSITMLMWEQKFRRSFTRLWQKFLLPYTRPKIYSSAVIQQTGAKGGCAGC